MNKTIIGFSGKKKSGKNSCANFIFGNFLMQSNLIKDFSVTEEHDGDLIIKTIDDKDGIFKIDDRNPNVKAYLEEEIYPFMKPFYFADPIKQTCITLFGLDPVLVYGSGDAKERLTNYTWDQFYNLIGVKQCNEYPNSGFMTIREILKFFGTEVLRKRFDPLIHANRTLENIENTNTHQAYILDVRFPDEVEAIQAKGGKVIRLTKKTFEDNHESEIALDNYPLEKYDAVIDNENLSIEDTFRQLLEILDNWGCL